MSFMRLVIGLLFSLGMLVWTQSVRPYRNPDNNILAFASSLMLVIIFICSTCRLAMRFEPVDYFAHRPPYQGLRRCRKKPSRARSSCSGLSFSSWHGGGCDHCHICDARCHDSIPGDELAPRGQNADLAASSKWCASRANTIAGAPLDAVHQPHMCHRAGPICSDQTPASTHATVYRHVSRTMPSGIEPKTAFVAGVALVLHSTR
eukprot:2090521-Prymnesium_polylepis.3